MGKVKILFALCMVGMILALVFARNPTVKPKKAPSFSLKLNAYFCAILCPVNRSCIDLGCSYFDPITNAGIEDVENYIKNTYKYIALGNGTAPTASSTSLDNEQTDCGLARKLGDVYDLGLGKWELNTTFTYTCDSERTVNTTASFSASSGGTMYAGGPLNAEATFSANGDQLIVRHIYNITEV
ncbi:MAG TPA: hypothetical protein ENG10_01110 [Candidatus Bathyarchaeota archaeon]|nr:hypothetical protein [Candidatus Bathyarchaeota archaeon]HEX68879.1 hypothetical protein [Candidatus Bathyarchaeota archaeon]